MFAKDASGVNVYNRLEDVKPRVKIGNWVEELALWEEQQRQKLTGEKWNASNTIRDLSLDQKSVYTTSNSNYGNTKARRVENPVVREPKVSVIKEKKVNPYLTKRAFEAHLQAVPTGHDILNREPEYKGDFTSTTRSSMYIAPTPAGHQDFEQHYDEAVTLYNPTGGKAHFGRSAFFTGHHFLENKCLQLFAPLLFMNYIDKNNQSSYFTDNELRNLRREKVKAKIADVDYLSAHQEINAIIEDLYIKVLHDKPDDIYPYVSKYFIDLYSEYCNATQ